MSKIEEVANIGVFTKDQRRAKDFFVRKVGLKVRDEMPDMGYLALGTTKGGKDAALCPWEPNPEVWDDYEEAIKAIGQVTGIGFRTLDLEKTTKALKAKRVKVESMEEEGETWARFHDPDGNSYFLFQAEKPKIRRAGLSSLEFVTVVSRDLKKAGEFFTKALGLRARKDPEMTSYRVSPGGTAISPFTPRRQMYESTKAYESDMAHIGEKTYITFSTKDLVDLQDRLLKKGVRFRSKAERRSWGGMRAEIYDPDDNVYVLIQERAG